MFWVDDIFVRGPGGLVAVKGLDKTQAASRVRIRGYGRPFLEVYHHHLKEIYRLYNLQSYQTPTHDLAAVGQGLSES
jgi:hypothetical protein